MVETMQIKESDPMICIFFKLSSPKRYTILCPKRAYCHIRRNSRLHPLAYPEIKRKLNSFGLHCRLGTSLYRSCYRQSYIQAQPPVDLYQRPLLELGR